MSTDRELLELAAKASGYLIDASPMGNFLISDPGRGQRVWNPLLLDGDAFRLAADLRMNVEINEDEVVAYGGQEGANWVAEPVHEEGGVRQASRRAIVRAAAEIERAMP